jgi:hypothetical protein
MAWRRSRGAVSTVVALRRRFDAIRRSELQRLDFKLTGLNPTERGRVEEVTRLIVEKLLIEPTEQLKALPRINREPDGRPDSYDLWLRIAGCERLVYMSANFNGRVVTVSDESGCLQ